MSFIKQRKDECFLCHRRSHPVYKQPSGIYYCDREDCNEFRIKRIVTDFQNIKGKEGKMFRKFLGIPNKVQNGD